MAGNNPSPHKRKTRRKPLSPNHGFYTPFEDLDQYLAKTAKKRKRITEPLAKRFLDRSDELDDAAVFRAAMEGVRPLHERGRRKVPRGPRARPAPRFLEQEEWQVLEHLAELVRGEGEFELTCSDEHIDGAISGLSPKIVKKLRSGDFSYQAHLDLHGHTRAEARERVVAFVRRQQAKGLRCVLIICGRGLNSKNREPVLKEHLVRWFTRSPLKGLVLAFSCARSYDGGAGAFYVLLRRTKGNAPIVTPAP